MDTFYLNSADFPSSDGITRSANRIPSATNLSKYVDGGQEEFTIIWNNLTYKAGKNRWYNRVKNRFFKTDVNQEDSLVSNHQQAQSNGEKIIIDNHCGYTKSRQLTAIMGPSGAGKSTLLHCLFQGRVDGAVGQILVERKSKSKLKVCFIPQHDYLNEWLTVREDLIFVSKLKSARVTGILGNQADTEKHSSFEIDSYVKQAGKECCTSLIDHEANALHVADLLGLNYCLDVRIKNISGGQKKRLSIARELMSKPDILVLDEPTTGLDSLTCLKTIKILRNLAHHSPNAMAIVVTIHQPQKEVFNLFDKTYFISSRGRVIYDDNPKTVIETIRNVANLSLPTSIYNPASFLIEIASNELQDNAIESLSNHHQKQFYELFRPSYLKKLMDDKKMEFCNSEDKTSLFSEKSLQSRSKLPILASDRLKVLNQTDGSLDFSLNSLYMSDSESFKTEQLFISIQLSNCLSSHSNSLNQSFKHIFTLTHRSWYSFIRNPTLTKSRLIFHTLLPLMMLLVFGRRMGTPSDCPEATSELSIQDMIRSIEDGVVAKNVEETRLTIENVAFFFILMYGFGINLISSTASYYPLTIQMFRKETINGLYSAGPYFIGQTLAELPLEIFFPAISILISYPLTGQIPSFLEWRMFTIAYIVFLVCYSIHALGLLCGAIFVKNISIAVIVGQILLLPQVILSGFIIRPTRMSDWMVKLSYTSVFRNGLTAIICSRYGFNSCQCNEDMLTENGETVSLKGMTPNVKHVIDYLFPSINITGGMNVSEVFDTLGQRFVKSQTFGIDIKTCEDVKPHIMHLFDLNDFDIFIGIGYLILTIVTLKIVTFSVLKSFPYRIS